MRIPTNDEKILRQVAPASLRAYAEVRGWKQTGTYGRGNAVFEKDGAAKIVVPKSQRLDDYALAVHSILAIWSRDENREEVAILRDLFQVDRDIIRIRAPRAADDGSIAIEAGVSLFHNAREMLIAAACAAREPKRSYRTGSHKEAQDYIGSVRLGQTEQGSYVITLLSPVPGPKDDETPLVAADATFEPFERRVTSTLASSLEAAHKMARSTLQSGKASSFEETVAAGVNANLCDALASLIDQGQGVDVSVAWAPTMPMLGRNARVSFLHQEADALREGAAYLRSSEPQDVDRLEGYVSALGRDQDRKDGHITLKAFVEGKLVSVKLELSSSIYERALEAHANRKSITVAGRLEKHGQRWHLLGAHKFRVVDDFDELLN